MVGFGLLWGRVEREKHRLGERWLWAWPVWVGWVRAWLWWCPWVGIRGSTMGHERLGGLGTLGHGWADRSRGEGKGTSPRGIPSLQNSENQETPGLIPVWCPWGLWSSNPGLLAVSGRVLQTQRRCHS